MDFNYEYLSYAMLSNHKQLLLYQTDQTIFSGGAYLSPFPGVLGESATHGTRAATPGAVLATLAWPIARFVSRYGLQYYTLFLLIVRTMLNDWLSLILLFDMICYYRPYRSL
jgi:hypothetical protein